MIQLIVSGDDFGLHASINEAIEKCHKEGVLTSASVVVNGEAIYDAIKISKRNPKLGIGIHLTLIEEKPMLDSVNLAPDGYFPDHHYTIAKNYLSGKISSREIYDELEAQIIYAKSHFSNITHIDSHRHLHMLPGLWEIIKILCKKYDIHKMRYVNVPIFDFQWSQTFKCILSVAFKGYKIVRNGFYYPDFFVGFMESGNMTENKFVELLNKLKNGTYEIGLHPGSSNEKLNQKFPKWNSYFSYDFSWENEMNSILSKIVKDQILQNKIKLINYGELN